MKILFISFRWNNDRLKDHSSDRMMSFGFSRAGWDIHYYDYRDNHDKLGQNKNNETLLKTIVKTNPDLIFCNKCERISPTVITEAKSKGVKCPVIFWNMDARKNLMTTVIEWSRVCDWCFDCKAGYRFDQYYNITKCPMSLLLPPYQDSFIRPKPFESRDINVSWLGQLYNPTLGFDNIRRDIIPAVRHLLDAYGACFDKSFIRGDDYYNIIGSSLMSISIPAIDLPYYFSNRQSHLMGSGTVVLSYDFKNCNEIFKDDHDIVLFKNSEELIYKINHFLNNKDSLKQIHLNTLDFAKTFLTVDAVYNEIIHTLKHGESSYPFGQTINPDKRKIDIYV